MTWTYDIALATAKDQIRSLIGDTDSTDPLLQDEEIAFYATQESGVYRQAAACCRTVAGKFARRVDRAVGDLRLSSSQQATAYLSLAGELLRKAAVSDAVPYAGGISIGDKDGVEDDTDRVVPKFTRTTGDVPGIGLMDTADVAGDQL